MPSIKPGIFCFLYSSGLNARTIGGLLNARAAIFPSPQYNPVLLLIRSVFIPIGIAPIPGACFFPVFLSFSLPAAAL